MADTTPITLGNIAERLVALEYIVENLLPVLIMSSREREALTALLEGWEQSPPPHVQDNEAFQATVGPLLDALLRDARSIPDCSPEGN